MTNHGQLLNNCHNKGLIGMTWRLKCYTFRIRPIGLYPFIDFICFSTFVGLFGVFCGREMANKCRLLPLVTLPAPKDLG